MGKVIEKIKLASMFDPAKTKEVEAVIDAGYQSERTFTIVICYFIILFETLWVSLEFCQPTSLLI